MELELVSIKESSQGCRGSGRQERRRRLIIQMGYDYHSAGVPPSWSAARWPTVITNRGWRICSSEGAPSCDEMNLISFFNFRKRGRKLRKRFVTIRRLLRVSAVQSAKASGSLSAPWRNGERVCEIVCLARTTSFNEVRSLCFPSEPLADSDFYPSLPGLRATLTLFMLGRFYRVRGTV